MQRKIWQERDSDTTLVQDFVAPAPYHMPIEVVSLRVREHQHQERTAAGVVSWTERVERESVNEEIRGRSQWNQVELCNWAWETEVKRWADKKGKECDQIFTTEARILSVFWETMICLGKGEEEIAILLGNSSILNQQSTRTVNSWTEIEEKQTEFIVTRRQMTETNQQPDSYTTRKQELLRLPSLLQTNGGFWWM